MQKTIGTKLKLSAIATAVLIAGCGGGGGGSSADPGNTILQSERSVQGTAAKGLIKGARVEVFAVDAQGTIGTTAIATATTGNDGTYSLRIPSDVLNFVIQVTAAPGAVMADEANPGQDIPVPASLKLRSVATLPAAAESTYTSSITPFTELVARTAEKASGGKLPLAAVSEAKTGITKLLGFDPEKVKPINSNSAAARDATEAEKLQSLSLAAISKLAKDGGLACGQGDSGDRIACVVSKVTDAGSLSGGSISLDSTRSQLRTALEQVAVDNTINNTGKNTVIGLPAFSQDKAPTTPGAPSGVEAAKRLFASLRNTVQSYNASDLFSSTARSLKADLDTTIAPLDSDLVGTMKTVEDAVDYLDRYKGGTVTSRTASFHNGKYATCMVAQDASSIACDVTRKFLPAAYTSTGYTQIRIIDRLVLTQTTATSYSYTARAHRDSTTYNYGSLMQPPGTSVAFGEPASGTVSYIKSGSSVTDVTIAGTLPARVNAAGQAITDFEVWNVNAKRTAEGNNLFTYALAGEFVSKKAGQDVGRVQLNPGSQARVQLDQQGNVAQNGLKELNLSVSAGSGRTSISGGLRLAEGKTDKNGMNYLPTDVRFTGSVATDGRQVFSGLLAYQRHQYENEDLSQPESETNFSRETIGLTGSVALANRPVLKVSISASRTGLDSGSVTAQYDDGTAVINATLSGKPGDRHPLVTVSSADGVRFEFTNTSTPVPVMKDGARVAMINLTTGIVNFNDGAFESLK